MRILFGVLFLGLTSLAAAQVRSPEQQIHESLRALPEAMRINATVIGYIDSKETILKAGSGSMICRADDPNTSDARGAYFVNCFPKSLEAFEQRRAELGSSPDLLNTLRSDVESGRLKLPNIAMRYTLRGHSAEGAVPMELLLWQ